MKIASVLTYYYPHWTGLTSHAVRLNEELVKRGHTVSVLTTRHQPDLRKRQTINGVQVHRLLPVARFSRGWLCPTFPYAALRLIPKVDVVQIHTPLPEAPLVAALCRVFRKPLIMTHHGDVVMPEGEVSEQIIQRLAFLVLAATARLTNAITAYSKDYADHSALLRPFGHKLHYVYPPVQLPAPRPDAVAAWRAELGAKDKMLIGFAGRWVEEKGFDFLLEALPRIREAFPNVHLLYAGDQHVIYDNFFEKCRPLVEASQDHLTFVGLIRDPQKLADFYAMCDLMAIPSRTDNMPLVEVEALQCGTPLVVSDIPGARVVVQATGYGQLAPARNPQALADVVVDTLRRLDQFRPDPARVASIFSLKTTIDQYEQLMKRLTWERLGPVPVLRYVPSGNGHASTPSRWTSLSADDHQALDVILRNEADMAYRRRARILLDYLQLSDGERVFDCGCGMGFYLMAMGKLRRLRLVGLDGDMSRLRWAQREGVPAGLLSADMLRQPFLDGSFDKMLMTEVLEHVSDDGRALREAFRILRPGGVLAISVPHANYPFWWDPINGVWTAIGGEPIRNPVLAGIWSNHERLYQPTQLIQRVQEAGFIVEQAEESTHYSLPFIHFLVYGIGKPLIEHDWLPARVRDNADRFRGDRNGGSLNPVGAGVAVLKTIDQFNDRPAIEGKRTFVNVLLKARKP